LRGNDMDDISVVLGIPIQLGRTVVSSPVVRASLDNNLNAKVRSRSGGSDPEDVYMDLGATALLVLGTPIRRSCGDRPLRCNPYCDQRSP
jgi:hypothetical protein